MMALELWFDGEDKSGDLCVQRARVNHIQHILFSKLRGCGVVLSRRGHPVRVIKMYVLSKFALMKIY